MRNYSPNYIGLVKAAGVSDFVYNALSGLINNTLGNQSSTNSQPLNVTNTPTINQPQQTSSYSYVPKPEFNAGSDALEAQQYHQWYTQQMKNYDKEQMHQHTQNSQIEDARRLSTENKNITARDKQVMDSQIKTTQPNTNQPGV